jgi:DNA polymerase (family 10)
VKLLLDADITTVEQLEHAAQEGRLRTMRGLGEKSEQDILRGIGQIKSFGQRATLGVASELAAPIMEHLRGGAPVQQMEAAGSLRRAKESIGDLDILVTSDQPAAVMERFVNLDLVSEVIAHGPTKSTVMTHAGMQADIRVVAPESFGAALQYFTGSKEHNIALRDLAVRKKLKLNEYGVFKVTAKSETRVGGATEEEMYAAVGLPWMPPELREDQGELDAAREGKLPALIELSDIRGDLQMHSTWSDGHHTIEQMARAAKELGYAYVAITDHSPSQTIANGVPIERLARRAREIEAARRAVPGITILNGTEVDIKRDGTLDYPDEVLAQFDFVIASVHSGWKMGEGAMTARILQALENPHVHAMAHPTGRIIGKREPYQVDIDAVLRAAARLGVAMEINAFPDRLDLKDTHARHAKSLGVPLLINTDSHATDQLPVMRFGVSTARRGWIEKGDVLNTLPAKELVKRLRRASKSE